MPSIDEFLRGVEQRRSETSASLKPAARAALGQFFTPRAAASLLASMAPPPITDWRLIDPGAGVGSLTAALVARWLADTDRASMSVVAYEIDPLLVAPLEATLEDARVLAASMGRTLETTVRNQNFILAPPAIGDGNIVLMNPPYKKLNIGSDEYATLALEEPPVRATNLYAAFLIRALRALPPGGGFVAITPRSFTNGPYFRDLRSELLQKASFRRIHLFEARNRVFADTDVLQENLVFSMQVGAKPSKIEITTSRDAFETVTVSTRDHRQIVHPSDPQGFIRLPLDDAALAAAERMLAMPCTLSELGCRVSTGRVVDFRVKAQLRQLPGTDTAPLIYPQNLRAGFVEWPVVTTKPQALLLDAATYSLLLPNEHYVVVKRFSAKEEPRRVVAAVASPDAFSGAEAVAFENHLNVFHAANRGLDPQLALGLSAYLNTGFVDSFVRQFSGHTQINATDLRELRYPTLEQLRMLGLAVPKLDNAIDPDTLDELLNTVVASAPTTIAVAA